MAAINFPSSGLTPNVTTYSVNGKTWIWDGVSWKNISSGYTGSQGYTGSSGASILGTNNTWSGINNYTATAADSDARIGIRRAGNGLEWGHPNTSGYGSALGGEAGTGAPFIALNAEAGTTSNTYRTRGIRGVVLKTTNDGGFVIGNLATASADNQSLTSILTIAPAGGATFANNVTLSAGVLSVTGAGAVVVNNTSNGFMLDMKVSGTRTGQIYSDATNFILQNAAGTPVNQLSMNWSTGAITCGAISSTGSINSTGLGASSASSFVGLSLYTSDAGGGGPVAQFFHESASPAAGDECGGMSFYGRDSANNTTRFALITVQSNVVTDASEAGEYIFYTQYAGSENIRLRIKGGLYHGNATGGDKGDGTINFTALYDDNTLLTCYVRDVIPGQELPKADIITKWDAMVPNLDVPAVIEKQVVYETTPDGETVVDPETQQPVVARVDMVEIEPAREEERTHIPLRKFLEKIGTEYDPRFLESYHKHFMDKKHLTSMPNPAKYDIKQGISTGMLIQRLVETVELQHLHAMELLERIKALEAAQ